MKRRRKRNQHGHGEITTGVDFTLEGVQFFVQNPENGEMVPMLTLEPEYARVIATNLTLSSYACEELRRLGKI